MELATKLFINGDWLDGNADKIEVINPAYNEPITEIAQADENDVRKAIESAKDAFKTTWSKTNPLERSKILHRMGQLIEENLEFIAQTETKDVGKPIYESRNIDVTSAAQTFHYFADVSVDIQGEVLPGPFNEVLDYTLHEPIGVVGAIIPWNFPFLIACRKIASALAYGNTVVIKP